MELQKYLAKFLNKYGPKKHSLSEHEEELTKKIEKILDYKIQNVELFVEAFSVKTTSNKASFNYERLEFLGDSILGAIISAHLFELYPDEKEGFLTQMKSKIVSRKNLNKLGDELGLKNLIQNHKINLSENISGNLFEALIGAIYIESGYRVCKNLILKRMFTEEKITHLENKIISYKSLLLEWSQKRKVNIHYDTQIGEHFEKTPAFKCIVTIDGKKIANATDVSKKKAEEKAAQRAFYYLNKKEHIVENNKTIA